MGAVIDSVPFKIIIFLLIILNAVSIGIQTDYDLVSASLFCYWITSVNPSKNSPKSTFFAMIIELQETYGISKHRCMM